MYRYLSDGWNNEPKGIVSALHSLPCPFLSSLIYLREHCNWWNNLLKKSAKMDKQPTSVDKALEELRQFPIDEVRKEPLSAKLRNAISQMLHEHCEDFDLSTPFGPYGVRGEAIHRVDDAIFIREQLPAEIAANELNKKRLILVDDNRPAVLQLLRSIKHVQGPPIVNDLDQQQIDATKAAEKKPHRRKSAKAEKKVSKTGAESLGVPKDVITAPISERTASLISRRTSKKGAKRTSTPESKPTAEKSSKKRSTKVGLSRSEALERMQLLTAKHSSGHQEDEDDDDTESENDSESSDTSATPNAQPSTPKTGPTVQSGKVIKRSTSSESTPTTSSKPKGTEVQKKGHIVKKKKKEKAKKSK
ncbi:hypothetical protein M514_13726, partial [Trichuris suis]|uniref:Uncharacterized protein n=1 Tax=Trichuris suis TaxID=68888 RepID=A0A085LKA3_9BILA